MRLGDNNMKKSELVQLIKEVISEQRTVKDMLREKKISFIIYVTGSDIDTLRRIFGNAEKSTAANTEFVIHVNTNFAEINSLEKLINDAGCKLVHIDYES